LESGRAKSILNTKSTDSPSLSTGSPLTPTSANSTPPSNNSRRASSSINNNSNANDVVRSEAEYNQIIHQLSQEAAQNPQTKYFKTLVKIPSQIIDKHDPKYIDKNGLVQDPMALYEEQKLKNPWTEQEKDIFLKQFINYQKNFGKIATYLPKKSTQDVVLYYYLNKRTLDLKKILKEIQLKRKTNIAIRRGLQVQVNLQSSPGMPKEMQNLGVGVSSPSSYWSLESPLQRRFMRGSINYAESTLEEKTRLKVDGTTDQTDSKWTELEKNLFTEALETFGKDFKAIANYLGTKTLFQCKNFYHNYKKKFESIIEEFNNKEQLLKSESLSDLKPPSSSQDTPRKEKEPKSIIIEPLEDQDKKSTSIGAEWSMEEKMEFVKLFELHGKNWRKLSTEMPGRSQSQIKNYYLSNKDIIGESTKKRGPKPAKQKDTAKDREKDKEKPLPKKRGPKPHHEKEKKDKEKYTDEDEGKKEKRKEKEIH